MINWFCRWIDALTALDVAVPTAIGFVVGWIVFGIITHVDPYPFMFLNTVSGLVGFVMLFVIKNAQKEQTESHEEHHVATRALTIAHIGSLQRDIRNMLADHARRAPNSAITVEQFDTVVAAFRAHGADLDVPLFESDLAEAGIEVKR